MKSRKQRSSLIKQKEFLFHICFLFVFLALVALTVYLTLNPSNHAPVVKNVDAFAEEIDDVTVTIEYFDHHEDETETESLQICDETETETETYTEEEFYDDLELLAYCVMAEAGNQEEFGQRLVIDCILNRVDSEYFPGTVREVIFQKNPTQFAVTTDGSLYKNEPTEDIYRFIREEIHERTNNEVFYFNSIGFNTDGEEWRKVGAHYFSKLRKELQK